MARWWPCQLPHYTSACCRRARARCGGHGELSAGIGVCVLPVSHVWHGAEACQDWSGQWQVPSGGQGATHLCPLSWWPWGLQILPILTHLCHHAHERQ